MSTYPFRGGPWHGFIIEYVERALPHDRVNPRATPAPGDGLYHLNVRETVYIWADGAQLGGPA